MFKISQTQTFESIKAWIDSKKSKSKKSSNKPPFGTSSLPIPIPWPQTPSKTIFPLNSVYKAYLKKVQEQVDETFSMLEDSDNEDDEDTAFK